jgi:hypothetical protein
LIEQPRPSSVRKGIYDVLNDGRGWSSAVGLSPPEQGGKELRQTILSHPSVQLGDWRKHYDAVRVLRAAQVSGRKIYVVQLESAGLPPTQVSVDAETGDVLREERKLLLPIGGAMQMTMVYSDFREIGGMRLPYRTVTTTEPTGRLILEVEKVEVGVRVSPRTFTPSGFR